MVRAWCAESRHTVWLAYRGAAPLLYDNNDLGKKDGLRRTRHASNSLHYILHQHFQGHQFIHGQ